MPLEQRVGSAGGTRARKKFPQDTTPSADLPDGARKEKVNSNQWAENVTDAMRPANKREVDQEYPP